MNGKLLLILFGIVLTVDVSAKTRDISVSANDMPLKEVLMIFSDAQQPSVKGDVNKYLHIKGIKWQYGKVEEKNNRIYNTGQIKLKVLKSGEIEISGQDGYIREIELFSPKPSERFKHILRANLGNGVVKEMVGCRDTSIRTKKAYTVNFKGKPTIYVNTDANFKSEPSMSPLYTYFQFSLKRPADWKC